MTRGKYLARKGKHRQVYVEMALCYTTREGMSKKVSINFKFHNLFREPHSMVYSYMKCREI